jgi:hypothetical protein
LRLASCLLNKRAEKKLRRGRDDLHCLRTAQGVKVSKRRLMIRRCDFEKDSPNVLLYARFNGELKRQEARCLANLPNDG